LRASEARIVGQDFGDDAVNINGILAHVGDEAMRDECTPLPVIDHQHRMAFRSNDGARRVAR
jgi:hypothetical protein